MTSYQLRRNLAVLVITAILSVGLGFAVARAAAPASARRATYALQSDLWGYPYKLRLRHCAPSEDVLVTLRMVEYRPADSVVIYRCVTP